MLGLLYAKKPTIGVEYGFDDHKPHLVEIHNLNATKKAVEMAAGDRSGRAT